MGVMVSQIASLTIVYSTVYPGADQGKHQSSMSLAFVQGIHRWLVNSQQKWPVMWKNVSIWWRHHVLQMFWHPTELSHNDAWKHRYVFFKVSLAYNYSLILLWTGNAFWNGHWNHATSPGTSVHIWEISTIIPLFVTIMCYSGKKSKLCDNASLCTRG